jgi:hypothetical protein
MGKRPQKISHAAAQRRNEKTAASLRRCVKINSSPREPELIQSQLD